MKTKPAKVLIATLCATSLLSGCVTNGSGNNFLSTTPGANGECEYNEAAYVIGGAIIGIGIGLLAGGDNRGLATVAGGAAGGLAGKGLQSYLQSRCKEIAAAQKRMKESELNVQAVSAPAPSSWVNPDKNATEAEQGVVVTVSNAAMFPTGSHIPTKSAAEDLRQLAMTYVGKNRKVLIVGHTDSTGPDQLNRDLSEKRAREVAKIFEITGVDIADLYYKGAGADRPIASNLSPEGRSANRRVEVVELGSEQGIIAYDNFVESSPSLPARVAQSMEVPDAPPPPKKSESTSQSPKTPESAPTAKGVIALKPGRSIDFGGLPIDEFDQNLAANVEKAEEEKSLLTSLWPVSEAQASSNDDIMLGTTCINDSYRPVGNILSLDDDKPVHQTSDYISGLYSTTWHDSINDHLVGITKVAILEDSGLVAKSPGLFVFEDYKPGDQNATLSAEGSARSYVGENGVVYRVFFEEDAWPVRCLDAVFPLDAGRQGASGRGTGRSGAGGGGRRRAARPDGAGAGRDAERAGRTPEPQPLPAVDPLGGVFAAGVPDGSFRDQSGGNARGQRRAPGGGGRTERHRSRRRE